jgi:hypothetical protein
LDTNYRSTIAEGCTTSCTDVRHFLGSRVRLLRSVRMFLCHLVITVLVTPLSFNPGSTCWMLRSIVSERISYSLDKMWKFPGLFPIVFSIQIRLYQQQSTVRPRFATVRFTKIHTSRVGPSNVSATKYSKAWATLETSCPHTVLSQEHGLWC